MKSGTRKQTDFECMQNGVQLQPHMEATMPCKLFTSGKTGSRNADEISS